MASRYQKVALVLVTGFCLAGITFQHYVRGPRMRLELLGRTFVSKNWSELVECFSDKDWQGNPWTKEQTAFFLQRYMEPLTSNGVETVYESGNVSGEPYHHLSLESGERALFGFSQYLSTWDVWQSKSYRVYLPLGWYEGNPSPLRLVRAVAQFKYHRDSGADPSVDRRLQIYEFLLAEKEVLKANRMETLTTGRGLQPALTIDGYLRRLRSGVVAKDKPFDELDRKYSNTTR